jgi:hypothetical protein
MHPTTLAYRSPDPAVVNLLGDLDRSHTEVVKALRILHAEYGRLTPHLITETGASGEDNKNLRWSLLYDARCRESAFPNSVAIG